MKKVVTWPREHGLRAYHFVVIALSVFCFVSCESETPVPPEERDTTAPKVTKVTPAVGSDGIAITDAVTVTFDEPMDESTIDEDTFTLGAVTVVSASMAEDGSAGLANEVIGEVRVGDGNRTASFIPEEPFDPKATYRATITTGVADAAGNHMAENFSWTFTTSTVPAAKAGSDQDVNRSTTVTLDGTGSFDPDGATLVKYEWTQLSGPAVSLAPAGTGKVSFTSPGAVTTLEFSLVVGTGTEDSVPDRVVIRVFEDRNNTYFVSTTGAPGNPGTRGAPLSKIQDAIAAAKAAGRSGDVYVAGGSYPVSLTLESNIGVYGGYDSDTWLRNSTSQGLPTSISGTATAIFGSNANSLTLDSLTIKAGDAVSAGESSYAVRLVGCLGVTVSNCVIISGDCQKGIEPANVTFKPAKTADGFAAFLNIGGPGGQGVNSGGKGGNGINTDGPGLVGQKGEGVGGGSGGDLSPPGQKAEKGGNGQIGAIGSNGLGGVSFGSVQELYFPAGGRTGSSGFTGGGGGGGAGGRGPVFPDGHSGGGGGGGAGGTGGRGALGGGGGGGSFGIYLVDGSTCTIVGCVITSGNGGEGGTGALGGPGGDPGVGMPGSPRIGPSAGDGGDGGDGGRGGQGGPGGGGGGGPSIGVVVCATCSAPNAQSRNSFNLGAHGVGGTGGVNNGKDGEVTEIYTER